MISALTIAIALGGLANAQNPEADSLTGIWRMTLGKWQNHLELTEQDGVIKGKFHPNPEAPWTPTEIRGVRAGKKVQLFYTTRVTMRPTAIEEDVAYTYEGEIGAADRMSGSVRIAGETEQPLWTAMRVPATTAIPTPIPKPKTLSVPSVTTEEFLKSSGKWKISEDASPIDDSKVIVARLECEESTPSEKDRATLVLRWKEGELSAFVSTYEYLGASSEAKSVVVRVDKQPARTEEWSLSTDGRGMFAPNAQNFMTTCMGAQQIVMRYTPFRDSPRTVTFAASGGVEVARRIMAGMKEHLTKAGVAIPPRVAATPRPAVVGATPVPNYSRGVINIPGLQATPRPGLKADPMAPHQESGLDYLRRYRRATPVPGR